MQVIVSSPAKIHLMGEHSVVYGKPALLVSIEKRLKVEIEDCVSKTENESNIDLKGKKDNVLIKKAVEVFIKEYEIKELPPFNLNISSSIPIGCGMGSSAALSCAVIGALSKKVLNIFNPQKINSLTFKAEKYAHGNPSGADNTTVVFGGFVWFRKETDFLRSIWHFPAGKLSLPKFCLVNSGRPVESTKEMVEKVSRINTSQREKIFSDQEVQTKKLLTGMKYNDKELIKRTIVKGERNLEQIGIVGRKAKYFINKLESINGYGKVCGAGGCKEGSGVILCFHNDLRKVKTLAKKYDTEFFTEKIAEEGIRIEKRVA